MKIKTKALSYDEVCRLPAAKKLKPKKPNILFRALMHTASSPELKKVDFTCKKTGLERLGKNEPCLYLMNHSSFIDLKIASELIYPKPYNIVCTSDGFVGKAWLMRNLGCIPTKKFVSDFSLIKDISYALHSLGDSVLMYPEASYSFDGTATPLPESLGKCLKYLKAPVVMIKTSGAFIRDPLYNGLRLREVKVSAEMKYLLSCEDIKEKSCEELNAILAEEFSFDNFKSQKQDGIRITEPFRAEGLNRVLYKCPACGCEGKMSSNGTKITCSGCNKTYDLNELGELSAEYGETEFSHIPDWYAWERKCVRDELEKGTYRIETPVTVYIMKDYRCVYNVGKGTLTHSPSGFSLIACDGKLNYSQKPLASYSLYADYFWYEIGDVICIGDEKQLYYCFPEGTGDIVAKARIAAEELYKSERRRVHSESSR